MRKIRLFLVACAAMAGLSQAQAVTVEKPGSFLTFQAFNPGDTVFLYNVKAEMFYMNGNAYSTQTSLSSSGAILTTFVQTEDEEETTYFIWDRAAIKTAWTKCFVDNLTIPGLSYVDEGTQGNDHWRIIDQGNNTYRIQSTAVSVDEVGDTYFGWDGGDNTIVYPLLDAAADDAANYGIDWKIVSAANGDSSQVKLFVARTALYEQMVKADAAGVTYSYDDIYNGTDVDDINTATQVLQTAVTNAKLDDASDDNPVEITELIKDADCESLDGWTTREYNQPGTAWQTQGNGNIGTGSYIERWVASSSSLGDAEFSQIITGLPAGSYELKLGAVVSTLQSDQSTTITGAYLFANDYKTALSTGENWGQSFTLGFVLNEGEDLKLGVKLESTNANYFGFDNFSLTYYGKGTMALKNSLQNAIDQASELAGAQAYEEYLEQLEAAIENGQTVLDNAGASAEELTAALTAINEAIKLVNSNVSIFADLQTEYDNAQEMINNYDRDQYTEVETLEEYCNTCEDADGSDLADVIASTSVDNETAQKIITTLQSLEKKALYSGIVAGKEITDILADPNFDNGGIGTGFSWEGLNTVTEVSSAYHNCEAYSRSFNIYQTLTDLPTGVYTLKIQAFERVSDNVTAWNKWAAGDTATTAILYTNDNTTNVNNIFKYAQPTSIMNDSTGSNENYGTWPSDYQNPEGTFTPNSMQGTMYYMNIMNEDGTPALYDNATQALVTDGTLTFGIKGDLPSGGWVIFDNIRLFYDGNSTETLKGMIDELATTVEGLKDKPMCADSLNAMTSALTACQNNTTGGDELVALMQTLQKAINAARNSISNYSPLVSTIEWAQATAAANERTNGATAKTTLDNLETGMNKGEFQDAEIDDKIIEVKRTANQYLMSDIVANAESYSAENPAECSFVIQNATYEENATDGWTAEVGSPGVAYHCYEMYNQNFDVKQILYGMPAGAYRVDVTGFYRDGWNAGLAEKIANDTWADNVVIVLNSDSAAMARIVAGAADITDWTLESEDYYLYDEDNSLYIPNNMQNAEQWLINETTAPLLTASAQDWNNEGDDLVIGMTKTTTDNGDWTIVKGWKLYYLGKDADAVEAINAAAGTVVSQQIFNASGAQRSALQKGLNILKQKMSDGTTRVKKVIVK